MLPNRIRGPLGAAALIAASTTALAHVTFETEQAPANTSYKAVLRVPHGCAGQATRGLRITVPEGVVDVKPMPKPGWTLTTTRGPYAKPYELHGKTVTEGVLTLAWSGGELADEHTDEFVFRARLTEGLAGRAVPFPVVQDCETTTARWTETAAEGQSSHTLEHPAPILQVTAAPPRGTAAGPARYRAGAITIEQPWSRATPGGAKVAVGYMRLTNTGTDLDRLVGGSVAAAGRFEVHEMSIAADGVMRMHPLDSGIEIRPGESVELRPGGYHAMLLDLARPLREGETFAGTLTFEKGGTVEVVYAVRGLGAQTGGDEHKHH